MKPREIITESLGAYGSRRGAVGIDAKRNSRGGFVPLAFIAACAAIFASPAVHAQPTFEFDAITLSTYVPSPGMGTGVAVADFDGDGDPDIFVPTGAGVPNLLFRNRGDGTFDEVAAQFGLADLRQARVALWVDFDGDGDLDLFVGRDCFFQAAGIAAAGSCSEASLSLFEQRSTGFEDISASVGLSASAGSLSTFHAGGLSAGDVSGDGLPDIYFARWLAGPELYISDTLFVASEAPGYSLGSGLAGIGGQPGGEWQTLFHDFDRDGRLDMFVNVDFGPNQLWMNGGDLNFANVAAAAGVDSEWNEMGLAAGDYDNDGDLDIYITNIHEWQADVRGEISRNRLFRNDSQPGLVQFTDTSLAIGVDNTEWGWGTTWLDADNDGDLDLAATNGYCEPPPDGYCNPRHEADRSRFFENPGDGSPMIEVGELVGFDDTLIGAGLVAADFDGDGRLDLLQSAIDPASAPWTPLQFFNRTERLTLYLNRPVDGAPAGRYVVIRPRMVGSNSHAIGAVVRVYLDGGEILTRLVQAGESWMSQGPATLHFGLGAGTSIDRVEIDWPDDGGISVLNHVRPNRKLTVYGPAEMVFLSSFE